MVIPRVKTISVPSIGIHLVDSNDVPGDLQAVARDIMVEVLQKNLLQKVRPLTRLCGDERDNHEKSLYTRAKKKFPLLTFSRFLETIGDQRVRDDSDADPRLGEKTMIVFTDAKELLGSFTVYNLQIFNDPKMGPCARGMAMPGCKAAPRKTLRETWGEIMRTILEDNIVVEGYEQVDFIEWVFPTRPGHEWIVTLEESDILGLDNVSARVNSTSPIAGLGGHEETLDSSGVPVSVRRKDSV